MAREASKENLLVKVLRKIPIFNGLSPTQIKRILGLCVHRQLEAEEFVCRSGTPSDEMYVVLSGEVAIVTPEGLKVATILPVTTVGELGVITGQPRNATVVVTRPSTIFAIQRASFEAALKEDPDMKVKVFRAIIDVLSSKLTNDNIRLRDHQMEKDRFQGRISILERKLAEQTERTKVAVGMAAESKDLTEVEIELHIADQVKELTPRILVVDDEPEFRTLVQRALSAFEVVEAENGKQALDIVHEETLDLVLTDLKMPEMDGFALLKSLRSQFPSLPVLAVSGHLEKSEVDGYDFDGFVEKPVALKDLQNIVEESVAKAKS